MTGRIEAFEDLIAWRKARTLAAAVYTATDEVGFSRDFSLRDQMRRAAVSVMSNIAEGFERHRLSEFHQFLSVAKGSCAELRSQLYVALDVKYLTKENFEILIAQSREVALILGGLRSSVQRHRDRARH